MNTPTPHSRYQNPMKALSFGEIVWDVIQGQEHLGGAPLNLAAHLAQMGCASAMISRLGRDRLGRAARVAMTGLGMDVALVQEDPVHPTGIVDVAVDERGDPTYTIRETAAYDFIELDETLERRLVDEQFDAFCFGTLAQRNEISRKTLRQILDTVHASYVFYDVNLRQQYNDRNVVDDSLRRSKIVKLNDAESHILCELLFARPLDEHEFARQVQKEYEISVFCITKGAGGCSIYVDGLQADFAGHTVEVVDTVGAGDAFSAAFLFHYCQGGDAAESARVANQIGAYVASCAGAIPAYDDAVRNLLGL